MSKGNKRGKKRRSPDYRSGEFSVLDDHINREKQKARDLRKTPWWKRKIQEGICYYCKMTFPPVELTMDHKIPLSRGGMSEKINIVPACKECNNKKKYLLPTEWEDYMLKIKKDGLPDS